jgi:hypothetical protein|tara:strand:+ start:17 stop:214 length:198 start_codon:yes stop_codon:yes gene_type:complete
MLKITATKIKTSDLKEGDLFSAQDQGYWDGVKAREGIGERLFIRTSTPVPEGEKLIDVYKLTIEK